MPVKPNAKKKILRKVFYKAQKNRFFAENLATA